MMREIGGKKSVPKLGFVQLFLAVAMVYFLAIVLWP